jgi:hypothetical protein
VLLHGLTDQGANRNRKGAAVHLRLELDGQELARFVRPNRMGWEKQVLDVSPGLHQLTVEVTTSRDSDREYCFEIQTNAARSTPSREAIERTMSQVRRSPAARM